MEHLPDGRVRIHWMAEVENGPINVRTQTHSRIEFPGGCYMIACQPKLDHVQATMSVSGETHVVTCPECQRHPLFKERYVPAPNVAVDHIPPEVLKIFEGK